MSTAQPVKQNLLASYPNAKRTKMRGLYVIGKDKFLIQLKIEFYGSECGFQGTFDGTFKEAIRFWKSIKTECRTRAREKYRATSLLRLKESKIKLFL